MHAAFKLFSAYVGLALLGACTSLPFQPACVGTVITPPAGPVETADAALLASAIGEPAKGALCMGKVFVAEKPVTVYRVWDAAKSYTLLGRWWSLSVPVGPRDTYRVDNDICPEWSPLDKMSHCAIKVGTKVVIGPGQSAQCDAGLLPASATNQVYIPNDARNDVVLVESCSGGTNWPEAAK